MQKQANDDGGSVEHRELESLLEGYVYGQYFERLNVYIDRWPREWRSHLVHQFAQLPEEDQSCAAADSLFKKIIQEANEQSVALDRP